MRSLISLAAKLAAGNIVEKAARVAGNHREVRFLLLALTTAGNKITIISTTDNWASKRGNKNTGQIEPTSIIITRAIPGAPKEVMLIDCWGCAQPTTRDSLAVDLSTLTIFSLVRQKSGSLVLTTM